LVNGSNANRYIGPDGLKIYTSADIGDSTTQFDITKTGSTVKYLYDGTGTNPLITTHVNAGDVIHIMASNFATANKGAFSVTAVGANYFEITNASGSDESNKTIGTGAIRINGHLKNSPIANKINYYKDRLYLGDYTATTRYKTGLLRSSTPLGIVALVDGDHALGSTIIKVTDTKYIHTNDILEVFMGGEKITTLIVTTKTENSITVVATDSAINSSDELWVGGTYTGKRVFRWVSNPDGGVNVKQYDSLKMPGSESDRIKMFTNIGNVMVIANNTNLAFWNDQTIQAVDVGIGCCSDRGFVKNMGRLFFLGYDGIYQLGGAELPQLISNKVEPFFTGASKTVLEAGAMGKKGTSIFCALSAVTLYNPDGSTKKSLTNVVIEYDLKTKNFYIHDNISAEQFCTYRSSANADSLQYASKDNNYQITEFLTGQLDDIGIGNKEINFQIDSGLITLSREFEKFVYVYDLIIEVQRGSGIKVFASLDGDRPKEIYGEAVKGCTILRFNDKEGDVPVRCRQLEISIRDNTKKIARISRIALRYRPTLEEEEMDQVNYGK
jgi:hypothetical protein